MNWMELTASLVRSMAWPVAVVVAVVILRKQLAAILDRVGSAKVGPVEVIFDRELNEVRQGLEQANEQTPDVATGTRASGTLMADLDKLADASPPATVLEAFAQIEQELRQALLGYGEHADRLGGERLARRAHEVGIINQETYRAIQGLSVLRNLAAHSPERDEIDGQRAREFAVLADAVVFSIEEGLRKRRPG
jgi:hypothetical protein